MIKALLPTLALLAACDDGNGDHHLPVCSTDAMVEQLSIDLPPSTSPIAADLVVRGSITPRDGESIFAVLVAGLPANQDAPNFTSFDVTVPLATLQSLASAATAQAPLDVPVEAITTCDAALHRLGSFPVTLRASTDLRVVPVLPTQGYLPTTRAAPIDVDVIANVAAAGTPLTVNASQGTLFGTSGLTLARADATTSTARFVFAPDPAKDGTAAIVVQAGTLSQSAELHIVASPTLNPPTASVAPGTEITVFVSSSLGKPALFDSIAGCKASASANIEVHNGPNVLGQEITPLVAEDLVGHPVFRVHAFPFAPASAFVTVTCYDTFGQAGSGTYTVPE